MQLHTYYRTNSTSARDHNVVLLIAVIDNYGHRLDGINYLFGTQ